MPFSKPKFFRETLTQISGVNFERYTPRLFDFTLSADLISTGTIRVSLCTRKSISAEFPDCQ